MISSRKFRSVQWVATLLASVALIWLAGCTSRPPSDEQLQQQAAKTTEQVKAGAKQAAEDAKVAAANAERKINDVAQGVKEGWKSGSLARVNINTASQQTLETLPGIRRSRAARIIQGRPYADRQDLVSKGILTQQQLDRISEKITTE
ncbi:MAG: helix-hairpin-helix domain-containing protein [Acidobacterium ailaaui]|nr:helix-hairpin-helix domain-containing protein [Pseudacidobacterium ailaaui]